MTDRIAIVDPVVGVDLRVGSFCLVPGVFVNSLQVNVSEAETVWIKFPDAGRFGPDHGEGLMFSFLLREGFFDLCMGFGAETNPFIRH